MVRKSMDVRKWYVDGLVQNCSISIANVLDTLQSCIKPSMCVIIIRCEKWEFIRDSQITFWCKMADAFDIFGNKKGPISRPYDRKTKSWHHTQPVTLFLLHEPVLIIYCAYYVLPTDQKWLTQRFS